MSEQFSAVVAVHDEHHRGAAADIARQLAAGRVAVAVEPATGDVVNRLAARDEILVVTDAFGGGPPADALFDPVAEAILTHVRHPVLVVGPRAAVAAGRWRLLVAADWSDVGPCVVPTVARWHRSFAPAGVVVVALDPPDPWPADDTAPAVDPARRVVAELGRSGVEADLVRRAVDDAATGLLDVAAADPAGVLVVPGLGGRQPSHWRATSRRLVRRAPCPVLVANGA